jgi:alanine racemase
VIRCTFAHVDLAALQSNFRAITRFMGEASGANRTGGQAPSVVAVVKANAYGHGAAPVALALEQAGATMVACADIEEAIVLRRAGVRAEILVFGALGVSDVAGVFEYGLTPTISTPSAGRALQAAAAARGLRLRYHLKVDTGMNRLGFRFDNLRSTLPPLLASPNLEVEGVYTHFATADDAEHPLFALQRDRFEQVLASLPGLNVRPRLRHAANSAALLRDPRVWLDSVRPGLLMYGVVPEPLTCPVPLKPALTLRSRIVAVKGVRPGDYVGYGARWRAHDSGRIAVVPAGYADGLDLRLAGRGHVLVRGTRAPVIGSVCMDMIMIDVTGVAVEPGDEVVIIGSQGGQHISVRDMAAVIGTSPYEVLCRVGTRIERIYNPA